jgi:hypothetical protein
METEPVPETLYLNQLTRLIAREDYIESCRRESLKTYTGYTQKNGAVSIDISIETAPFFYV